MVFYQSADRAHFVRGYGVSLSFDPRCMGKPEDRFLGIGNMLLLLLLCGY